MKSLNLSFVLLVLLFSGNKCLAQTILNDQKGEPLFVVPSTLTSFKLSSKVVGLDVPVWTFVPTQFYVADSSGRPHVKAHTMRMSRSFYLGGTLVENTKGTLVFGKATNVSPSLELGFRRTLDALQLPALKSGFFYTFSFATFLKYQHFNVYDKLTQVLVTDGYKKVSPGLRAGVNVFRKDQYALSFNGSWQKSVNTDKLNALQTVSPTFYSDALVATAGETGGYFGPLAPENQFRLAVAWSVYAIPALNLNENFRFSQDLNNLQVALTPYYFITTEKFEKLAHNGGIGLSFLPGRIYRKPNGQFSDALTVSYNFIKSSDKENARFIYIAGTFSFGKPKAAQKEREQK